MVLLILGFRCPEQMYLNHRYQEVWRHIFIQEVVDLIVLVPRVPGFGQKVVVQ